MNANVTETLHVFLQSRWRRSLHPILYPSFDRHCPFLYMRPIIVYTLYHYIITILKAMKMMQHNHVVTKRRSLHIMHALK